MIIGALRSQCLKILNPVSPSCLSILSRLASWGNKVMNKRHGENKWNDLLLDNLDHSYVFSFFVNSHTVSYKSLVDGQIMKLLMGNLLSVYGRENGWSFMMYCTAVTQVAYLGKRGQFCYMNWFLIFFGHNWQSNSSYFPSFALIYEHAGKSSAAGTVNLFFSTSKLLCYRELW